MAREAVSTRLVVTENTSRTNTIVVSRLLVPVTVNIAVAVALLVS
jgi:hypothetical protein